MVSIELVLLTPIVVVGLILFPAGAFRFAEANSNVDDAAYEAARAASLERDVANASAAGVAAAQRSLADAGKECGELDVAVDVSSYEPGGAVQATVTCTADLSDVVMAGFPSTHTFEATATVPIEQLRGG